MVNQFRYKENQWLTLCSVRILNSILLSLNCQRLTFGGIQRLKAFSI